MQPLRVRLISPPVPQTSRPTRSAGPHTITPAKSRPGMRGKIVPCIFPATFFTSLGLIAAPFTATSTSSPRGSGVGTSSNFNCVDRQFMDDHAAFIGCLLQILGPDTGIKQNRRCCTVRNFRRIPRNARTGHRKPSVYNAAQSRSTVPATTKKCPKAIGDRTCLCFGFRQSQLHFPACPGLVQVVFTSSLVVFGDSLSDDGNPAAESGGCFRVSTPA